MKYKFIWIKKNYIGENYCLISILNLMACIQAACLRNSLRNTFNTSMFPNRSGESEMLSQLSKLLHMEIPFQLLCIPPNIFHQRCYFIK